VKQLLVDANVLISFLNDRNPQQQEKAAVLLHGAAAHEYSLVFHSMSLVETIYVLTQLYHEDPTDVSRDVEELLGMPGVTTAADVPWRLVLDRWPRIIPALGDAILAAVASQGRYDAVATFDRGLAKKLIRQGSALHWSPRS
jgi:predicted nucleic acid-binding protein